MPWTAIALVAALAQPPAEQRPWLGVSMTPYGQELTIGEQSFPRGIRIEDVLADSAAQHAGLLAQDIIVTADGVDFAAETTTLISQLGQAIRSRKIGDQLTLTVVRDVTIQTAEANGETLEAPDVWQKVQELLDAAQPGTIIEFRAERVRQLVTVTARLKARPSTLDAAVKTMPPNEEILPHPVRHLPEERLVDALVAEFGLEEAYRDQRQRLAEQVAEPDWLCLSRFAFVMREPFTLPELSRRLAKMPDGLAEQLAHAGRWLDLTASADVPRLRTGLSAEEHAQQLERLLKDVHQLVEQAFGELSEEERAFLNETVDLMADAFRDDIMIQRDPDRERLSQVVRLVRLATKVDRARLVEAAIRLSALTDSEYLAGLRRDLAGKGAGVFLTHETELGDIVFAGSGDSWFQKPAAVIVDLGGNDFYTNATQQPLSVLLDLGGNDEYAATFPRAQAAGLLGVSLLYDHAGDDTYICRRWGQGAGVFGVGVLVDHAGNDTYRGGEYTQATAFCGVGLLLDEDGDDRYEAQRFGQALGLPGGFAALVDRSGNDHYYCKGRDLGAYGTPGIFAGWGQGCGTGFRGVASGGVALLLDESGNDVYEAGNFSQGGGYYYGWGALIDRSGDDQYWGSRYAQAFAAHQSIGYFEDYAGDDLYMARRDVGQSCSWDLTVTMFIDHAGDDWYSAGGFALGASAHNGLAVFVDAAGRDHYQKNPGRARAGGNDYHGGTSLSLVLDLGGAEDVYAGQTEANNTIRRSGEHGLFADVPGDLDDALRRHKEWIKH